MAPEPTVRDRVIAGALAGTELARAGVAAVRWPTFSITSYTMVRGLVRQGIVPDLVIDVGANQGQFTSAVLGLIGDARGVAFEPIPSCADALHAIRDRFPGRLRVIEAAIGAERSTATLTINAHSQSSSLRSLTPKHLSAFPDATPAGTATVEVLRLDEVLADHEINSRSLLKLDVQGFEREAMEGAGELLTRFGHVIVEASFRPLYEGEWTFIDLLDFARERGLKFVRPVGSLRDPRTGEYLQIDALFTGVRRE